jgi:hypothetical protein
MEPFLPTWFCFTQMQFFNVRDNNLSGTIPRAGVPDLDVLNLSRNRFSGPIPTTVVRMIALIGPIEQQVNRRRAELSALNLLEDVRLEDNDLTAVKLNSVCTLFSIRHRCFIPTVATSRCGQ